MRSNILSKLIFASCVWYSDRAYYGLCVLIKGIGRRLPLKLQCSYQGQRGDVRQSVRGNYKTCFWGGQNLTAVEGNASVYQVNPVSRISSPSRPSWLVMVAPIWMLVSQPWHVIIVFLGPYFFSVLFTRIFHSFITKRSPVCFAADKGSLSVFKHVNSVAMHLKMSLRLPGSPQSLPDGTVAQTAELKALIPHTTKVEARNQYRVSVQVLAYFLCSCFSMILIQVPVYGTEIQKA